MGAFSINGTNLVTSSTGTSFGSTKYYPYGVTRSGSVPTDEKFTGQKLDDTGLYYYNARYYDPTIGRFISPDTLVQNIHNPQCLNRYSYVLNNPLKYIDPSGHRMVIPGNPPQNGIPFPGPEDPGGSSGNGDSDSGTILLPPIDNSTGGSSAPRLSTYDAVVGTLEVVGGLFCCIVGGVIIAAAGTIPIPIALPVGIDLIVVGIGSISDGLGRFGFDFYIPNPFGGP
ncbi:MAG: RHS repeat-associated core domain-containing protein [Dehalococcoides mccartyi]|uniref:RHS repeat-associated core domain-containing protein n=1 Tax=Dehalococcoides mccartyi TaxID=61435 RepID=UPI00080562C2|nr:RHS repeat-associated core domain-containing protein [Dehalococcoides mccartyi]OBW62861.1 MAG: RHS repeat-associated core domain-containing protein [Dehalococcoides mccartyi]